MRFLLIAGSLFGFLIQTDFVLGANRVTSTPGEAVVQGTLLASQECREGRVEAWLSLGDVLLYQAEVPIGGTFEFHTLAGNFNLVATSSTGCFVEEAFTLKLGETREVSLKLLLSQRSSHQKKPANGKSLGVEE